MQRRARSIGISAALCATLVAVSPPLAAAAEKLKGEYTMTLKDGWLKLAGAEGESVTESWELGPVDIQVRLDQGGNWFGSDLGYITEENTGYFCKFTAQMRGFFQVWDGELGDLELCGGRSAGRWGMGNEQGRLDGTISVALARVPEEEARHPEAHSVYRMTGNFNGGIYHSGSNDAWDNSRGATGKELGLANGTFTVYLYVYLPVGFQVGTEVIGKVYAGEAYSVTREKMLKEGDFIHAGDVLYVDKDADTACTLVNSSFDRLTGGLRQQSVSPGGCVVISPDGLPPVPQRERSGRPILQVIKGLIIAVWPKRPEPVSEDQIWSQAAILGHHGTRLAVDVSRERETYSVWEGTVDVTTQAGQTTVQTGEAVTATEESMQRRSLSAEEIAALNASIQPVLDRLATEYETPEGGKYIHCTCKYPGEVVVHITWHQTDDTWHRTDWILPGQVEGYLKIEGEAVRADRVIYWAETPDGKLVWRGDKKQTVLDISGVEGDAWRFTLNAPR